MVRKPVIIAEKLTRRFGETAAVNELSLEVYRGEIFGFLGHNGAGKTTTVRLLNGVLQPTSGTARVLELSPSEEGQTLREYTGVLTETHSLDERLTGRENLTIFAGLYGVYEAEIPARVNELLQTFELANRADEKVGGYSKGMKQRLALARALLHRPQLLFLDEPTSGLDPVATRQVHDIIKHLSQEENRTVFMCTHNLNEAQKLCDRVAIIEHGQMVAIGTPGELAKNLNLRVRLEIEVDNEQISPTLDLLQKMPFFNVDTSDKNVISLSGGNKDRIPELLSTLIGGGVRVYRVAPQETTLEDVYFALHDNENIPHPRIKPETDNKT